MPPKKPSPAKAPTKPAAKPAAKTTTTKPGAKTTPSKTGVPAKKTPGKTSSTGGVAKKPATGGKSPAAKKVEEKPAKPVWTPQDDAARKIQCLVRRFLARKAVERKKNEKKEYEQLMEKLEREAYIKVAKMQQEEAQREAEKDAQERRRKKEQKQRWKRMLEAAFDGDNDEIKTCLKEIKELDDKDGVQMDVIGKAIRAKHQLATIDCEDANGNTPISEAASGGHVDTINLLLEKGANINVVGQFGRTPLYRAAFAGHLDAVEVLLQNGADPRTYASDGQTPEQVASNDAITQFIATWDTSQTDLLLKKIETDRERNLEEQRKGREAQMEKIEEQIKEAQKEYDSKQFQLNKAYCEMNKRIEEHDTAVAAGYAKPELTLQSIHDAETEVEIMKIRMEECQTKLSQLKLSMREQQKQNAEAGGEELPGLKVNILELNDVLLKDVGNKIRDSGKFPMIIDPSGQAATFLRYRDTNYLNALSMSQMEPDKVRLAVLGAIRFGKSVVVDMMEVDMFDTISDRFDEVTKGFMQMILDKSILKDDKYEMLIKEKDGDQYNRLRFNDSFTKNFKFVLITKNTFPSEDLCDKFYVLRVILPN